MKPLLKMNIVATLTIGLIFAIIAGIVSLLIYSAGGGAGSVMIWSFLFIAFQWYAGPFFIKIFMRLREPKEGEFPEIEKMVEKIAKKAKLPKPKLYIVNSHAPNAFAFGRTQKSANIALHTGLIDMLDKNELEGVIAHETGHIKNRDMITMTIASTLPLLLYYIVLFASPRRRERESPMLVFMGAFAARMLGTLITLWLSRVREYAADEFSARLTREPLNLASALEKITLGLRGQRLPDRMKTMSAFYIAFPRPGIEWLMTHPLPDKRIIALQKLDKELNK